MRANILKKVLRPENFQILDLHLPFFGTNRFWRSIGFRWKQGPLIKRTNNFITNGLNSKYDLIWVDKAIMLTPETTKLLKSHTSYLIHYTPDTAFFQNKSSLFFKSLPFYDCLITTKSFDIPLYKQYIPQDKIHLLTQGFDSTVHFPRLSFAQKGDHVLFIGLYEPARAELISELLKNGIAVHLAGYHWRTFVRKNTYPGLTFLGNSVLKDQYALEVSKAKFALGLISKRFPELHTTRTFEIPACGTALITERNKETNAFFAEDEVLFYQDTEDLLAKVRYYAHKPKALKKLTEKGTQKVQAFDYESQFRKLLQELRI